MSSAEKIVTRGKKAMGETERKFREEAERLREQAGKWVKGLFGGKKKTEKK